MRWEEITFVDFDDFYQNRKLIRDCYSTLSLKDKISYKRFVYDTLKECMTDKDCIWNFLNENVDCKKELAARVHTRRFARKNRYKNLNLFDIIELCDKKERIEKKRIDLLGLLEDDY